jgi:GTP pyrophosphokinase
VNTQSLKPGAARPKAGGGDTAWMSFTLELSDASKLTKVLRDISEVFAKEKMNVTGVHSQSVRDADGKTAWMTFTIEVADASRLRGVLAQVARVNGVRNVRRK